MPLFSEHISNMYYSGSPSYTGSSYGYSSSVSPLGLSYSASYLNPGGSYTSHSSLGGYSRSALPSRWISSVGRNYSPMLSTISERSTASPVRISSPRRIPLSKRCYTTSTYTPRPININTESIDVSRDKYRRKAKSPSPVQQYQRKSPENENCPFMPRVDGKPETGIDSSPGHQRTIKRDRTVVRLHTLKRKERDSPRKPVDELPKYYNTAISDSIGNSDVANNDTHLNTEFREKSPAVKDVSVAEQTHTEPKVTDNDVKPCEIQSLPISPLPSTSKSPDRRLSMELLAEQACLLDSLIRKENLSTATLDLSKVGKVDDLTHPQTLLDKVKIKNQANPLKTTKSDHSLHASLKSLEPKNITKRRSLKKSSSGGSICRLDSITEFPKDLSQIDLPAIEESRLSMKSKVSDSTPKPKLKTKITSSVDISPPKSLLKFRVENVTVEEKLRMPKKEITYSSEVDETPPTLLEKTSKLQTDKGRRSFKHKSKKMNISFQEDDPTSPEPEDGNFWNKLGKRETVYLIKRKQQIEDTKERSKRQLFWYPEEESGINEDLEVNKTNNVDESRTDGINEQPSADSIVSSNIEDVNIDDVKDAIISSETKPINLEPALPQNTDTVNIYQDQKEVEKDTITKENNIESKFNLDTSSILVTPVLCKETCLKTSDKEMHVIDGNVSETKIISEVSANFKELPKVIDMKSTLDIHNQPSDNMEQSKNSTDLTQIDGEKIKLDSCKSDENTMKEDISEGILVLEQSTTNSKEQNIGMDTETEKVISIDKLIKVTKDDDLPNDKEITNTSFTEFKNEDKATKAIEKDENKGNTHKLMTPSPKKNIKTNQSTEKPKAIKKVSKTGKSKGSSRAIKTKVSEGEHEDNKTDLKEIKNAVSEHNNKKQITTQKTSNNIEESTTDEKVLEKEGDVISTGSIQSTTPIKTENIPTNENFVKKEVLIEENKGEEDKKAETVSQIDNKQEQVELAPKPLIKVPPITNTKKIVKEIIPKLLIATPRPLQKRAPQFIHSSSSSESSTEESSEEEETESSSSEETTEFFECENNPDGRTSTGSNDSGFDSSAPTSPATFHQIKKGGDTPGASGSAPAQNSVPDILEQELEQSTAYGLFRKTGRFTPPARSIPRFRKYTIEDFHFVKVLGKGSFGKVLLAELRDTEYYYAVKCLKKDVVLEDDDVECTLIERKVLALGTNHPYLCHLFATFQTDSHLFFVMEYLNGGDLMFHIQQSGRFPEARARFYGAEIVSGLKFLHKRGIVYRDLKLDNILLDFDGHVRIADFGMCKLQIYLEKTADTFCGTPDYMAPEIIKGLKYNQAVDWWSFGVLLYEMLIGQSPFSGCDEDELFWSICNEMPSYPRFLSKEALSVLTRLLDKDARTRLGGAECMHGDVREQEFFRPVHWDRLERRELEAPFRPRVRHPLDTQYFDRAFTGERPRLTAVEPHVLRSMDQEPFRGFSYTNPNATDH